jgi:hypothetical protein
MLRHLRLWAVLWVSFFLFACGGGGGDSTTTTIRGNGLNSLGQSPAVTTRPVQTDNNLLVTVQDNPGVFQLVPNANILYATVKVCHPVSGACVDIDHVQVDTGSVGLRVLASKVKSLNLPPLEISASPVVNAYECFPFVIGGLWGANAKAVVGLGMQKTGQLAIQLIEDGPAPALQATADCVAAADNNILSSASALGSNGILGVGSTNLDCGSVCLDGSYAANSTFVQYYGCPQGAASTAACSTTASVAANLQVSNPISAFANPAYNNGVVLAMPAVTDPGAAAASGELIFGVDSIAGSSVLSNNTVPTGPSGARKVLLSVDTTNMDAYLNITTQLTLGGRVQTFTSSYLDTGTNGLFFNDSSPAPIARCAGSTWYCPKSAMTLNAVLSNGGSTGLNPVSVVFQVGNAEALFSTSNTAFGDAAGAAPTGSTSFAWGMPFFYGKRVYMSIWDITTFGSAGPWYAWTGL